MAEFNATCPFCGEKKLEAVVEMVNSKVPLGEDTYDVNEGEQTSTEILLVECGACKEVVPRGHYLNHDVPDGYSCDCVPLSRDNRSP